MRPALYSACLLLVCGFPLVCGCGDAKLPTLDEAKQAVSQTVEQTVEDVQQKVEKDVASTVTQATNTGKFKLDIGGPMTVSGCFARLTTFSSGRAAILTITSYADSSRETFPSVYVRAQLPENPPASLAGQIVQAQMYVQTVENGAVWHSDQPIEFQITAADATNVAGSVVAGSLVNTDTGARADVKGRFTASFH
jgi:hypothetical protein